LLNVFIPALIAGIFNQLFRLLKMYLKPSSHLIFAQTQDFFVSMIENPDFEQPSATN
jgi:hypothetical protein